MTNETTRYNVTKCPANVCGVCLKHLTLCHRCPTCTIKILERNMKFKRNRYIKIRDTASPSEHIKPQLAQVAINAYTDVIHEMIRIFESEEIK